MKKGKALRKCCTFAVLALGLISVKALPALADDGGFSVGLEGGWEKSLAGKKALTGEVEEDITDTTKLNDSFTYGLNAAYRLPTGLTLGVDWERFTIDLKNTDAGFKLGKVTAMPVMLTVGYQSKPENSGFGGHAFAGAGYSFNSFKKNGDLVAKAFESQISEIEDAGGTVSTSSKFDIKNSFVWGFGVGGDYFFNKNISAGIDARFLFSTANSNSKFSFSAYDSSGNLIISATDKPNSKVNLNNFQTLLSVKYWF